MNLVKKVLKSYRNLPAPVKASFWFILMSVLQKGISFFVTPVYTRLLTTSEYGYYSLYTSWLSIFGVFATLNLSAGVFNNGMLKYENNRYEFISSMQGLSTVSTIIVALFVFVVRKRLYNFIELDDVTVICMFLALLFCQSYTYWTEYQRYNFQYKKLVILTLGITVCTPLVSILFIYILQDKRYAVIFGYAIVQIVVGVAYYIYNWIKGRRLFNKDYWGYALKFNIPLIPHYLSYIILGQSDRIMINNLCGSDKLAVYSLAYNVSLLVNIVVSSINSVYTPWVYRKIKNGEQRIIAKYSLYILLLMAIVTIFGVLIAPELIAFLGTKEYLEAQWVVPPVMLGCFFTLIYNFFGVIEFYYEKSVYVMISTCTAAVINVILNVIFIPQYGYIAAAYTTLVCYFIMAFVNYFMMRYVCRKNKMQNCYDIKIFIEIAFFVTAVCLLINAIYSLFVVRYFIILILLLLIIAKHKLIINLLKKFKI